MTTKGSYILILEMSDDASLEVGGLGSIRFGKGFYAYAGSAMSGLEQRVGRHERLAAGKKGNLRWHIDYLTTAPQSRVAGVIKLAGRNAECALAKMIAKAGGSVVAAGFGSSDCKCKTHLFRLDADAVERLVSAMPDV
jgi:Uri superfamily endonuclease